MVAVTAAALSTPALAWADGPVDTVLLENGGMLRGTVLEHEATTTTIRLIDGTTRKVKSSDVKRAEYGEVQMPSAPASAPMPISSGVSGTTSAPAIMIVPAPNEGGTSPAMTPPAVDAASMAVGMKMRSKPAFVGGIVIASIGAVVAVSGIVLFASNSSSKDAAYRDCNSVGPCTTQHETYENTSGKMTGEVLMAGGGAGLVIGVIVAAVGGHRVQAQSADARPFVVVPTIGARSVGMAVHF